MLRPRSIVNFERCYLGALVVGLVNLLANWQRTMGTPAVQQSAAMIGTWFLPLTIGLSYLIPLALWYFAARRASVVAKWIIVVLFALGVVGVVVTLTRPGGLHGIGGVLSIVAFVLNGVAVWLLFRPDARSWFGDRPDLSETFG